MGGGSEHVKAAITVTISFDKRKTEERPTLRIVEVVAVVVLVIGAGTVVAAHTLRWHWMSA